MKTRNSTHIRRALAFIFTGIAISDEVYASTDIGHDVLNRVATVVESVNATRTFHYDPSGNRTNSSTTLGFSVSSFANQQVAANATLALPLATAGSLATESAGWTVRSSNHQLVPKSGIQVVGAGTVSPTVEIIPASGEVGTTRITVIASDGDVAAATSFTLTVGGNRPPLAINDSAQHPPGGGTKIERGKLLANDSDPDHDAITLVTLSATSAHGGLVRFFGPFVAYDPPAGYDGPDFFTYTLMDSNGATDSATVTLKGQPVNQNIPITVVAAEILPSGHRLVTFIGVPDTTYEIQASTDLLSWAPVGTSTSDSRGRYVFEDIEAETYPARFYRAVFQ